MTKQLIEAPEPCPFCGHVGLHFQDGSTHRWGLASCAGCGATCGEVRRNYPPDDAWHAAAIAEWNKRTPPASALSEEAIDAARHQLLNTPELRNFSEGVTLEALHQRERWGSEHDAGKTPADWFWLVGYLAGKALHAQTSGNVEKALHHTISTAAALANWHASIAGADTAMRPGIDPVARGVEPT